MAAQTSPVEGDHQRSTHAARQSTPVNSQVEYQFLEQPEQGESSRESSFLDHFLGRLDSNDAELGRAAAAPGVATQPQASPSNSVAALVSSYDALSPNPANPWQYLSLSNPPSPTSQRDYYNQLNCAHSSLYPSGGHLQRDLASEWMIEELDQQRIASQAHNQSVGVASRAPTMSHHHLQPPASSRGSNSVQRRAALEQVNNPDGANSSAGNGVEQTEGSFLYEEASAAWYRSSGYLRGPDLAAAYQGQGPYENFARLDPSGTHSSDSTSVVPEFDRWNVDGTEARMRWERAMASQYLAASGTGEMDGILPRPSRAPPTSDGYAPGASTRSANSVGTPSNTSLSSGLGGDDSDDEECARFDPPGSVSGDGNSSGKRKTPEPSGEEGNDSARTSSEADLTKTAASLPRKKLNFKKPREPRYAIKTRTDVDIMDDGFKWRKYGQKAVKNSPHPRNYYRCTTPQCPVRKRVERSHEDSGLVITTYEGIHTHQTPGLRSPAPSGGYFGERPPGPGAGLFHTPALGPAGFGPRFPFPPQFSLAALHQLRTLQQTARSLQGLAQHQITGIFPGPRFPGSNVQRESLLQAQQFLELHDPTFGSVKQEPFHFTAQDFMALRGINHGLPFPGRHFQPPGGPGILDRLHMMRTQQMRPRGGPPPPRHLPPMPDLDYPDFSPPPTDTDLVRRVLEAEEQELSGGDGPNSNVDDILNVDSSSPLNQGGPASPQNFASQIQSSLRSRVELQRLRSLQRSSQPPSRPVLLRRRAAGGSSENLVAAGLLQGRQPSSEDPSPVDGLLQEMVKPKDNMINPNVSK